ncbi:MAG: cache domain-containing protein, partial [Desulfuromusa sp.]|nr:cache domain-containing protein [Desulfuromusa sp.]
MKRSNRNVPFYVPVSIFFLIMIFASGISIAVFTYVKNKAMAESWMEKMLIHVVSETTHELEAVMKSPAALVRLGATEENIIHAASVAERLHSLGYMKESLLAVDTLESIYVGYPDGDYFHVRRAHSNRELEGFKVPEASEWVVQSIDRNTAGKVDVAEFLYFDQNLNLLARHDYVGDSSFDPRLRIWYQSAADTNTVVRTDPYVFFTTKKVGIPFAKSSGKAKGVVVGADIRLEDLSTLLSQFHLTPNSELAIFDNEGELVGHGGGEPAVVEFIDASGAKAVKQGSLVSSKSQPLSTMGKVWRDRGAIDLDNARFQVDKEEWYANVVRLDLSLGNPLYLGVVMPNSDLFEGVKKVHYYSILITLFILLVTTPLTIIVALMISRPLKNLVGDVEAIRRFDFGGESKGHSIISEIDELASSMDFMKKTISEFLFLADSLNKEKNFDSLLERISSEARVSAGADRVCTYLFDEKKNLLFPGVFCDSQQCAWDVDLPSFPLNESNPLTTAVKDNQV